MKIFGLVLVLLGIVALVYGVTRQRTILEVGPLKATATEQKSMPLSPFVGGIALISGMVLLALPRRRLAQEAPTPRA